VKGDLEAGQVPTPRILEAKTLPASKLPSPTGKIENVSLPRVFPSGSLLFGYAEQPFRRIARAHEGGYDIVQTAEAYRHYAGTALKGLGGTRLLDSFEGLCRSYATRRGQVD
jgi:hypothetical protein